MCDTIPGMPRTNTTPKKQPASTYATDLRSVAKILDQAEVLEHGDVYVAPGTQLVLVNGNGYTVGVLEIKGDTKNWKFTPHQDDAQ